MADAITFARSDEQSMLASTVREFLEANTDLDSVREMSLTQDAFDEVAWRGLAEIGVVGLNIPEAYGGAGYGLGELSVVFEELGRMVTPSPLLSSLLASTAILAAATDEQKAALLPSIASGETIATLAVFEDLHGSDLTSAETVAEPADGGWIVNGTKRFVTDAPNASLLIVAARVDGAAALFAVDVDADGVTVRVTPALDATRPLGEVVCSDVRLGNDAYLGHAPHPEAVRAALDAGVVALAHEQVGGAQRCLEMAVEYAKTRYQFGRAIGSFQAVKHTCADMLVAVEHAKSAAWHAARSIDDPDEAPISVSLAKSVCSDAYVKVAGDNIQVHGGIGFTWEHDAHLYFKRAKSTALLLGSVGSYRDRLGDAIGV
ncbi:MAG: acyl-CoA dehydrogenase family protein [Acidimicrobiia bacterium]|nr:MAG: acyl-CoA dehydrogenase family protein [Acidimicrobiia bacterium]